MKPLAVSIPEAAKLLGYRETYFRANVLPALRIVPGTRPKVPVAELERWLNEHAVTASSGKDQYEGIPSALGTTARGTTSLSASKIAERRAQLKKRLAASTSKQSPAGAAVIKLHQPRARTSLR